MPKSVTVGPHPSWLRLHFSLWSLRLLLDRPVAIINGWRRGDRWKYCIHFCHLGASFGQELRSGFSFDLPFIVVATGATSTGAGTGQNKLVQAEDQTKQEQGQELWQNQLRQELGQIQLGQGQNQLVQEHEPGHAGPGTEPVGTEKGTDPAGVGTEVTRSLTLTGTSTLWG